MAVCITPADRPQRGSTRSVTDTSSRPSAIVSVGESVELAPRNPRPASPTPTLRVDARRPTERERSNRQRRSCRPPRTRRTRLVPPRTRRPGRHPRTDRSRVPERPPDCASRRRRGRPPPEEFETPPSSARSTSSASATTGLRTRGRRVRPRAPLPPGEHYAIFAVDDDFEHFERVETTVEGPTPAT